jgi:hypothetical protein
LKRLGLRDPLKSKMWVIGQKAAGHPLCFIDLANQSEKCTDPALQRGIARFLSLAVAVKLQRFVQSTGDKVGIADSQPGISLLRIERTEAYRPLEGNDGLGRLGPRNMQESLAHPPYDGVWVDRQGPANNDLASLDILWDCAM